MTLWLWLFLGSGSLGLSTCFTDPVITDRVQLERSEQPSAIALLQSSGLGREFKQVTPTSPVRAGASDRIVSLTLFSAAFL